MLFNVLWLEVKVPVWMEDRIPSITEAYSKQALRPVNPSGMREQVSVLVSFSSHTGFSVTYYLLLATKEHF